MILLLCALANAGDFDHSYTALAAFYDGAVHADGIDYGLLAKRRKDLDPVLASLASADPKAMDDGQKLALYVNAYNAHTLATVLDAMPIASIMELDGGKVWDTRKYVVAGESLTLNELENTRIRKLGDARIHASVNCASIGCPPLPPEPLRSATLEAQLTAGAETWVGSNAYTLGDGKVGLSKVFEWYAADFEPYVKGDLPGVEGKEEAALWVLATFAPDAKAVLHGGGLEVGFFEYDWKLNARGAH